QYNRQRYYDPKTGRWMTQDPLGFDAGDSNLYRYVNNDVTNGTDPSGLIGVRVPLLVVGVPITPIFSFGVVVTAEVDYFSCIDAKGQEKTGITGAIQGDIGVFATATMKGNPVRGDTGILSSLGSTVNRWRNMFHNLTQAIKAATQGNWRGAIVAALKGTPPIRIVKRNDCPPEGFNGRVTFTGSLGFSTLTIGFRYSYYWATEKSDFEWGVGIGYGSGLSGGVGGTFTFYIDKAGQPIGSDAGNDREIGPERPLSPEKWQFLPNSLPQDEFWRKKQDPDNPPTIIG
ncbi:MAG TPA: RHS repeat-associated core domain-containing protein, partial [Gemmataceae bacterium]|nr:RHS repeat-associated core domain-containing protein [Gemmataceae bacterium]